MNRDRFKQISYIKNEALAGLTTSFAMVPETVAFAFVAGVNPLAGLYACFVGGLLAAIFGGRPGMISGGGWFPGSCLCRTCSHLRHTIPLCIRYFDGGHSANHRSL